MKLHLPVRLRKAVLACFSVVSVCTLYSGGIAAAADLTLAEADSLAVDYADSSSITDLSGGTLTLAGGTELLLTNCGEGDGKTYTLLTGVSSLLDVDGNPLTLTEENKAASLYFDTTQPGTGFWAGGTLMLDANGNLLLVRHSEHVITSSDIDGVTRIASRQDSGADYRYYKGVSFENLGTTGVNGGAIYGGNSSIITLNDNGSVTFSGNTASSTSSSYAYGGAIYGGINSSITLSANGSVTFDGNKATSSSSRASGGAIYVEYDSTITLSDNGSVTFSGNTASASSSSSSSAYAYGGAIYGGTITLSNNGSVTFSGNTASGSYDAYGGAINGGTITLS
ncbi:MAG: hypothetical protein Q4F35_06270, partial [Akkermansia sp.]|nr:hypothetical protein [Akkermansia sp.]